MSRHPKILTLAVVLSLLLAALPAVAQGGAARAAHARPGTVQTIDWLKVTWSYLSGLWSGAPAAPGAGGLTSMRGGEGASLDPDGKSRSSATTPAPLAPPPSDEGASLDPHG